MITRPNRNIIKLYRLLTDAYYGTGQFLTGLGLIKHAREDDNNYNKRRAMGYYLNYMGPIVNASVDPIFKDDINRDYKTTALFDRFLDDVDRAGTDLQDYIRRMATFAKLYTVVYIIVDNARDVEFDDKLDGNIESRRVPFLTHVLPENVTHWHFDDNGVMDEFEYRDRYVDADGREAVKYYKWTKDKWQIMDKSKGVQEEGENPLGRVPVVQWFGRSHDVFEVLPDPEFISVAQANKHLYQLCSMLTSLLTQQTFSILTMPDFGAKDLTIGVNNLLVYPPESSHAPSFIAPDSGPADTLAAAIDRTINEMYRMSGIDSVIGVQTAKSGVAKQWDFERTNQRLVDFALHCEKAEKDIIALYQEWTGEDLEYKCTYPRDFKINDVTECLTQAQLANDLNMPSKTFKTEIVKKVIEGYIPNIESDIYDAIIDEVEDAEDDMDKSNAFNDAPDDEVVADDQADEADN